MPPTNKEMTRKLQEIFHRPGLTVAPGGSTPFHAVMVERAGFEMFYQSGSTVHNWLIGWPDVGVATTVEFAENANRIAKVIGIPILADADTGGGNAVNVYRTVEEYIMAGVAGCHIEDVEYPKGVITSVQRPAGRGHDGELLVSIEEAVGKYKAAIAAKNRLDPNFVIVARTDARLNSGFEEVIKRAKAYEKAGVDVIMFEGMQSWEESRSAMKEVHCPSFIHFSYRPPGMVEPPLEQQGKDGSKIYLAHYVTRSVANQASWEILVDFKKRGLAAMEEWTAAQAKKPEEFIVPRELIPTSRAREIEQTYLPASKAGYPLRQA